MDESLANVARFLFVFGAVLAVGGPAIAVTRRILAYRRAKNYEGSFGDFDAMIDPERVRSTAMGEAAWGITEFFMIGLGVLSATVASIILIP
ncbi:hypothetical protein [Bacillus sp. SIMBA_005]|uniref:hypothetical protein n=1 Tax=Bacillus sp. SIMBA_005 TaxID=3085754 RepID=UPI00397E429C